MAYRYQKELDLLEATRGELNITDAQYNELTDAIKAQGGSAEGGAEPQAIIPGYESTIQFDVQAGSSSSVVVYYEIKSNDMLYHSFEPGLPVEITWDDLGSKITYGDYRFTYTQTGDQIRPDGPYVMTSERFDGSVITGTTQANQVPPSAQLSYGARLVGFVQVSYLGPTPPSDEVIEKLKTSLKIKIG